MAITLENKNYVKSHLASTCLIADDHCHVHAGDGAQFEHPSLAVIWSAAYASPLLDSTREIVKITEITTDNLTITRAQESTSAKEWAADDHIAHVLTAGKIDELETEINLKQAITTLPAVGPNLITNSGFGVWSNSTLENVGSNLITGWTNDAGAQAFSTFTVSGANLASCVATDSRNNTGHSNNFTTVTGKLYKVIATVTHTSGVYPIINIRDGANGAWISLNQTVVGANTYVYEETAGGAGAFLQIEYATNGNNAITFTVFEVTPGCVAADALGPDGWEKNTGTNAIDVWREHSGTYTKDGSFYALKMTNGAANSRALVWPSSSISGSAYHYKKFSGRSVVFGCWVWTDTANAARLSINDGTSYYSSYHTGGSAWEWLEMTLAISASNTYMAVGLRLDAAATAYFSQPMLTFGSYLGTGNYQPIPGEIVICEASTTYSIPAATASGILNLEVVFSGKIPKGTTGINVNHAAGNDAVDIIFGTKNTSGGVWGGYQYTAVAGKTHLISYQCFAPCDTNGDVYVYFNDGNFGASSYFISAVRVN